MKKLEKFRKIHWVILFFILMAFTSFPLPAAEIAVVRSNVPSSFWNETDILAQELPLDFFDAAKLDELLGKLDNYKLVIFSTNANYHVKRDYAADQARWLKFLNRGGIMLCLDGNYTETTTMMFGAIAPQPLNHSWGCSNAEEERHVTPEANCGNLFQFPYSGETDFPLGLGGGHYINPDQAWQVLGRCVHGHPVILSQQVGAGEIIVTPLFALFSANGKRFVRSFTVNLLLKQKLRLAGLELTALETDYTAKLMTWKLALKNISGKALKLAGRTVFSGNALPMQEINTVLAPGAAFEATLKRDNPVAFTAGVVLTAPESIAFTGHFTPPDLRPVWQLPVRIFSARAQDFTFPLHHQIPGEYTKAELTVDGETFPAALDSAKAQLVKADLSGIAPGEHTFGLKLTQFDGSVVELPPRSSRITADGMKLNVDAQGNLVKNGKPFFPIAWYHISRAQGVTAESRMACLEYCAKYGYNMILMHTKNDGSDDAFMARAAELGVSLFCDVLHPETTIPAKKAKWSAVVSWMHELDEPEHWGYTPEDVRRRANDIFALDDRCPVFSSMETALTVRRYAGVCDLIATHGYPVPGYPLKLISDKLRLLVDLSKEYMFVPLGTVQCFGYPNDPPSGYLVIPTPRQVRNLAFQALAANIKGITFYTWEDGGFKLTDHPELDALMQKLPAELQYCVPYLQNGEYTRLDGGNGKIVGARWTHENRTLQMWINTDSKVQRLTKPQSSAGMKPLFGSQAPGKTYLKLEPEEVVIWEK